MSKDEYYANTDARLNTILDVESAQFWQRIKASYVYWSTSADEDQLFDSFHQYLREKWGIELIIELPQNQVTGSKILDEQKYMLFVLKFS